MKISWLGHSSFKLEESTGTTIITDPFDEDIGIAMPKVSANAVTLSHGHHDHCNVSAVGGNPKVFNKSGVYDFCGVDITGIKTYHDEQEGALRGENIIYKFRMDGVEVCHLGDIGQDITPELIELLVPVNVLLIPVGGTYTLNAEQAKGYVDALMPDIVIPMHYRVKNLNIDITKADAFIKLFDSDFVSYFDGVELDIDREDLDEMSTRVIVLKRMEG